MKKDAVGLYLHIPFCVHKCVYCDFASWAGREKWMEPYAQRVCEEIEETYPDETYTVKTVYVGGGTPSVYPPKLMDKILCTLEKKFYILPDAEMSCEMNPGTVTEEFLSVLRSHGFNRVSMGMQAAQEKLLRMLGRIHTRQDVEKTAALIKQFGFHNFNLDLMLGLPNQTLSDVKETLDFALSLHPAHLSCYGLIVEEGTLLEGKIDEGIWQLPDVETERSMYRTCVDTLKQHGIFQYEISNFAKKGFECRHNADVWKRGEYIGIGCAAAGFLDGVRYTNPRSLSDYMKKAPREESRISREDAMFESIMLGLRLTDGITDREFTKMHGIDLQSAYGEKMKRSIENGLLTFQNGVLKLTDRGMDVQNSVLVDFM